MTDYIFDGSFSGFLTCIFEAYQKKQFDVGLYDVEKYMGTFLIGRTMIETSPEKAKRVWDGLGKRMSNMQLQQFYAAFLSEMPEINQLLFSYVQYIFKNNNGSSFNYGNATVLKVTQIAKQVSRERHRMKAFIRFSKSTDGLYVAVVNPDFNVLPLIVSHFKSRYADQSWLIYDEKRRYGILYNLQNVTEVKLTVNDNKNAVGASISLHEDEPLYTTLWQTYFKKTSISERKNPKLHLRHVPRRYWKYLTEKII